MNWITTNEHALDILGIPGNRKVLVAMEHGAWRFGQLQLQTEMNPRSLSAALKRLIAASLVEDGKHQVTFKNNVVRSVNHYRLTSTGVDLVSGAFLEAGVDHVLGVWRTRAERMNATIESQGYHDDGQLQSSMSTLLQCIGELEKGEATL